MILIVDIADRIHIVPHLADVAAGLNYLINEGGNLAGLHPAPLAFGSCQVLLSDGQARQNRRGPLGAKARARFRGRRGMVEERGFYVVIASPFDAHLGGLRIDYRIG